MYLNFSRMIGGAVCVYHDNGTQNSDEEMFITLLIIDHSLVTFIVANHGGKRGIPN